MAVPWDLQPSDSARLLHLNPPGKHPPSAPLMWSLCLGRSASDFTAHLRK